MRPPPVDVMPKRPGEDSPVVTPSAPRNMRREWSSEWAWKQLELLGSPLGYVTSARRNVASAPCVADGAPKLWVHLELQLPLQTLVGGAGNGRLSGLKSALRLELARSLSVASSQVEVWEILDKGGKTTVELVVSEALPSDDLSRVASDLMDQVQKNQGGGTDSANLVQLIAHVEIKDHRSHRLLRSFKCVLAVVAIIAVLTHGACGAPMLRSLSMRASNLGTNLMAVDHGMRTLAGRHPQLRRNGAAFGDQKPDRNQMTLMLDLDHTSIFGNDGNDLGVALQWVGKDRSTLDELYRKLVNPKLRTMVDTYRAQGKHMNIVIYTRRPGILHYRSAHYDQPVEMRYAGEFHADEQLYLPSSVASSGDIWATFAGPYLPDHDAFNVQCALERLVAARDAIVHELGLDVPPPVVVTAQRKNVEATARRLQLPVDSALLFDDNVELKGDARVVLVDKMTAMPTDTRADVLALMQREVPVEGLEPDLVEFLMEAPPGECSLRRDGSGRLSWRIPLSLTSMPWRTPEPLTTPDPGHCTASALQGKRAAHADRETLEIEQQISDCSDSPLEARDSISNL